MVDDLTALLNSRKWVKRRVDRVEFLDLTTVRRTIVFTLDLGALDEQRSGGDRLIPLGWFVPWANAESVLVDARKQVVPYLTSRESDERIAPQLERALSTLGIVLDRGVVDEVRAHRSRRHDPDGEHRRLVGSACHPGYLELMCEKWGCRAVLGLLDQLHASASSGSQEAARLAQILLAWQTNFVLFGRLDSVPRADDWATLQLSYDEELQTWEPTWEHRKRIVGDEQLSSEDARKRRRAISYGGPFRQDLDELYPRPPRGWLARGRCPRLRRAGRRGLLGLTWHVAWHQASGFDSLHHQVEVILPTELTAVRLRMLRTSDGTRYANRADQVGSRATIVAPDGPPPEREKGEEREPQRPPTLLSLVIAQRNPASWYGGAWIAGLTGAAILPIGLWWLPELVRQTSPAVTVLVIAPTLVAALLSVRAGSEIAEQLTTAPRRLIAAVGVLTALCALGLVLERAPAKPGLVARIFGCAAPAADVGRLQALWVVSGGLLLGIAVALWLGAHWIRKFVDHGKRLTGRVIARPSVGQVLNPEDAPRIPPPDSWLAADEGDLIPWGWLGDPADEPGPLPEDDRFWQGVDRAPLVDWIQEIFHYKPLA